MSNYILSGHPQYYDSARYANNQKDSLLRTLRAEIAELKQKNMEYDRLQCETAALDARFRKEI